LAGTVTPSGSTTNTVQAAFGLLHNGGSGVLGIEDQVTFAVNPNPPFKGTYYTGLEEGKEYQTILYDGSGTVLQTETSTWQQRPCDSFESTGTNPTTGLPPCWFGAANVNVTSYLTAAEVNNNSWILGDSLVVPEHDPEIVSKLTTMGPTSASV